MPRILFRLPLAPALFLSAGVVAACGDDVVTEPEPEPQRTIVQEVDVTVPVTTAARKNALVDESPWSFDSGAFVSGELADVPVDVTFRIDRVTYEVADGRAGTFEYANEDGTIVHGRRIQGAPRGGASRAQDIPVPMDFAVALRVTAENIAAGSRGPGQIGLVAEREEVRYASEIQQTAVRVTEDADGFDLEASGHTIVDDATLSEGGIRTGTPPESLSPSADAG